MHLIFWNTLNLTSKTKTQKNFIYIKYFNFYLKRDLYLCLLLNTTICETQLLPYLIAESCNKVKITLKKYWYSKVSTHINPKKRRIFQFDIYTIIIQYFNWGQNFMWFTLQCYSFLHRHILTRCIWRTAIRLFAKKK